METEAALTRIAMLEEVRLKLRQQAARIKKEAWMFEAPRHMR